MSQPPNSTGTEGSQRIVVGTDGSECGTAAVRFAAVEASRTKCALEIHTAYAPGYEFGTRDDYLRAMELTVETAARQAVEVAPDVSVTTHVHERAPSDALIEASKGANLLVVGTRGLGGFKGLLLGSVSQQCAIHAHCSVLIVR